MIFFIKKIVFDYSEKKIRNDKLYLFYNLRFFWYILFNDKVIDDEVLTFHRILTHLVFQKLCHLVGLVQRYLFQSHIWTDEMNEFIGRNLT